MESLPSLPFNLTDAAVVVIILLSGVFALFRGFVHELLAVVSWVGAAVATLYTFPFAQPYARKLISVPLVADVGAGMLIFLVVLIALSILTRMVSKRVRDSAFGPLDRSLGLVFGFLRGAVLICIAWLVFLWLSPREDHPKWIREARVLPLVEQGSTVLVSLLPAHLRAKGIVPLKSGATAKGVQESYQNLLNPPTKGDAPGAEPGYNSRMRDEMSRAVEGITGKQDGAE
jgi:membrane protein required for colicin V production